MLEIITDDWMTEKSQLAVLGGIIINCEGVGTDMFLPLSFKI